MVNVNSRRLVIAIVTSNTQREFIGQSVISMKGKSELEGYVELLSASNFCFDILRPEEIREEAFIKNGEIKYTVIIVATPFSSLCDSTIALLREMSNHFGISLISSFTNVDDRSKSFFGIRKFRGTRYLWPLKVRIVGWPRDVYSGGMVANYDFVSGLPGVRRRGLRKLNVKSTCIKVLKLVRSLFLSYSQVDLESDVNILAISMTNKPVAWSYQFGEATNYYFALDRDLFLDKFNEMHRLARDAVDANSGFGMVSVNLENTMVLRLDDPGACCADYLDNGGILENKDWEELSKVLEKRRIPLSVMYTPGWVDDGDAHCGRLFIKDQEIVERKAGRIYDSAQVRYVPLRCKNGGYDHTSEFRGLKKLVEKGVGSVDSHGLTHLDPDHEAWSKAKDKNKDARWYHEFFHARQGRKVEKYEQKEAMCRSRNKIRELLGNDPCALTPSGHRHDSDCDALAHEAGYWIFSADYTGILKNNIRIRNWKIPSLFLYLKDPTPIFFKSGYPIIGVAHDYEIKRYGSRALEKLIDEWQLTGVRGFISMRELATNLCFSVVGHTLVKEKKLQIVISPPAFDGIEEMLSRWGESKIRLRIVFPARTKITIDKVLILGENVSIKQLSEEYMPSYNMSLLGLPSDKMLNMPLSLRSFKDKDKIPV